MEITQEIKDKKALFKLMRESVGYTREEFAKEFGVADRSVRRWESPTAPYIPNDDAFQLLKDLRVRFDEMVTYSVYVAKQSGADVVDLYYYPSQKEFFNAHPNESGYFGFANAVTREVYQVLSHDDYEVRIHYR